MILIEITNVDELVRKNKGTVASVIGPWLTDVEAEVEKVIVEQLKSAFTRDGVKAHIVSVGGIKLRHLRLDFKIDERVDGTVPRKDTPR